MDNLKNIMDDIVKIIKDADAFIKTFKEMVYEDIDNGNFIPKWHCQLEDHRLEIICPMLYDDQIYVIYDTANKLVFSPSTDIEYLKEIIRNLESNKETLIG